MEEEAQQKKKEEINNSNNKQRIWMRDPPTDRPVRVYADGIYDLFHFGHARSLEQAKKSFPNTYLLVGCCNDQVTHSLKGKTVMTDTERYESLRHCKWVDEVIPDAPWVMDQEFIDKHQIDYVAHDSLPYADASGTANDVYEFDIHVTKGVHCFLENFDRFNFSSQILDMGRLLRDLQTILSMKVKSIGRFKETKRTEGISTSDIIMRIVKDYNNYVMRNLDRGYSRKDLGVSFVKEKRLRVNMSLRKLHEKVKKQQEKVEEKIHIVAKTAGMNHNLWVENADRLVAGFLEMFEEGCHKMGTAIRDRIQEQLKKGNAGELTYDKDDDDDDSEDDDETEYYYDYSTEEEVYSDGGAVPASQ